jgi:hypothetical protein
MSTGHGFKGAKLAHRVIASLLQGRTNEQAAADAGVARTTLTRWLRTPTFQRMYREARRLAVEAAVARLSGLALCAVEALERNLHNDAPGVEIKAALGLLTHLKALGGADLEERLAALEERVEAAGKVGPPAGRVGDV